MWTSSAHSYSVHCPCRKLETNYLNNCFAGRGDNGNSSLMEDDEPEVLCNGDHEHPSQYR